MYGPVGLLQILEQISLETESRGLSVRAVTTQPVSVWKEHMRKVFVYSKKNVVFRHIF